MRTVTFSNEKVAQAMNDSFVCTWINRNPKFHNCELNTEQRIVSESFEAYATKNFCSFFATPDQEVLHYMSGYYDPEFFLGEVDFVKKLAAAVTKPTGASFDRSKLGAFAKLHREREDYYAARMKDLNRAKVDSSKTNTSKWGGTGGARKGNLLEALGHLKEVNHWFWNEGQSKRVTALAPTLKNHLAGNTFTEE